MKIVHFPHTSLVTKSKPVIAFNEDLEHIANEMITLMHQTGGVGLAANQVAINKRIVVMQCTDKKPVYIFINPEIVNQSENQKTESEGCLSFPGVSLEIPRQESVEIQWQDSRGNYFKEKFSGLEAVCIQHEIDHLDGINFIDRIGNVKKMMTLKKYLKNKKN